MDASLARTDALLQCLRRQHGVATSAELAAALGVSQPTVSRALAPLLQSGQVRKVGAARSQRYLLPRRVQGVGDEVLLMRVDTYECVKTFISVHVLTIWSILLSAKGSFSARA